MKLPTNYTALVAAGGWNLSKDFLSAKAKAQLRDSKGRFIPMGGLVRWKDGPGHRWGFVLGKHDNGDILVKENGKDYTAKIKSKQLEVVKALIPDSPDEAKQLEGARAAALKSATTGDTKIEIPKVNIAAKDLTPATPADDPEPNLFKDTSGFKKVGGQGGSNPGGTYEDPETGERFYVKKAQSEQHAANEVLASKLYEKAGIATPEVFLTEYEGGPGVASKMVDGLKKPSLNNADFLADARKGFAMDAWLANWDVVGLEYDNLLQTPDGKPFRVDTGGALLYRAMGSPKGGLFGNSVGETETLRTPSMNAQSAKIFGSMTNQEITQDIADTVNKISDEDVDKLVDDLPFSSDSVKSDLKNTLKARRADLNKKFDVPQATEPDPPKAVIPDSSEVPSNDDHSVSVPDAPGPGTPGADDLGGQPADGDPASEDELVSKLASLAAQAAVPSATIGETNFKAAKGKVLSQFELHQSDQAEKTLKALGDEAAPLTDALWALKKSSVPDLTDPDAPRWSTAGEPGNNSLDKVGTLDQDTWDKYRDMYVVNDPKTLEHNASLRSDNPSPAAKGWATKVDKMIAQHAINHDGKLYRGAVFSPGQLAAMTPGSVLSDKGFMSTGDLGDALLYGGIRLKSKPGTKLAVFEIDTPKGQRVTDVGYGEFVLPRNSQMLVKSVREGDGSDPKTNKAGVLYINAELAPNGDMSKVKASSAAPEKPAVDEPADVPSDKSDVPPVPPVDTPKAPAAGGDAPHPAAKIGAKVTSSKDGFTGTVLKANPTSGYSLVLSADGSKKLWRKWDTLQVVPDAPAADAPGSTEEKTAKINHAVMKLGHNLPEGGDEVPAAMDALIGKLVEDNDLSPDEWNALNNYFDGLQSELDQASSDAVWNAWKDVQSAAGHVGGMKVKSNDDNVEHGLDTAEPDALSPKAKKAVDEITDELNANAKYDDGGETPQAQTFLAKIVAGHAEFGDWVQFADYVDSNYAPSDEDGGPGFALSEAFGDLQSAFGINSKEVSDALKDLNSEPSVSAHQQAAMNLIETLDHNFTEFGPMDSNADVDTMKGWLSNYQDLIDSDTIGASGPLHDAFKQLADTLGVPAPGDNKGSNGPTVTPSQLSVGDEIIHGSYPVKITSLQHWSDASVTGLMQYDSGAQVSFGFGPDDVISGVTVKSLQSPPNVTTTGALAVGDKVSLYTGGKTWTVAELKNSDNGTGWKDITFEDEDGAELVQSVDPSSQFVVVSKAAKAAETPGPEVDEDGHQKILTKDIKVGDQVVDGYGELATVTFVSPTTGGKINVVYAEPNGDETSLNQLPDSPWYGIPAGSSPSAPDAPAAPAGPKTGDLVDAVDAKVGGFYQKNPNSPVIQVTEVIPSDDGSVAHLGYTNPLTGQTFFKQFDGDQPLILADMPKGASVKVPASALAAGDKIVDTDGDAGEIVSITPISNGQLKVVYKLDEYGSANFDMTVSPDNSSYFKKVFPDGGVLPDQSANSTGDDTGNPAVNVSFPDNELADWEKELLNGDPKTGPVEVKDLKPGDKIKGKDGEPYTVESNHKVYGSSYELSYKSDNDGETFTDTFNGVAGNGAAPPFTWNTPTAPAVGGSISPSQVKPGMTIKHVGSGVDYQVVSVAPGATDSGATLHLKKDDGFDFPNFNMPNVPGSFTLAKDAPSVAPEPASTLKPGDQILPKDFKPGMTVGLDGTSGHNIYKVNGVKEHPTSPDTMSLDLTHVGSGSNHPNHTVGKDYTGWQFVSGAPNESPQTVSTPPEPEVPTGTLVPGSGHVFQDAKGKYVITKNGHVLREGDSVTSTKDGVTGKITQLELGAKYAKVKTSDGKTKARQIDTLKPSGDAAPSAAPAPAATPAFDVTKLTSGDKVLVNGKPANVDYSEQSITNPDDWFVAGHLDSGASFSEHVPKTGPGAIAPVASAPSAPSAPSASTPATSASDLEKALATGVGADGTWPAGTTFTQTQTTQTTQFKPGDIVGKDHQVVEWSKDSVSKPGKQDVKFVGNPNVVTGSKNNPWEVWEKDAPPLPANETSVKKASTSLKKGDYVKVDGKMETVESATFGQSDGVDLTADDSSTSIKFFGKPSKTYPNNAVFQYFGNAKVADPNPTDDNVVEGADDTGDLIPGAIGKKAPSAWEPGDVVGDSAASKLTVQSVTPGENGMSNVKFVGVSTEYPLPSDTPWTTWPKEQGLKLPSDNNDSLGVGAPTPDVTPNAEPAAPEEPAAPIDPTQPYTFTNPNTGTSFQVPVGYTVYPGYGYSGDSVYMTDGLDNWWQKNGAGDLKPFLMSNYKKASVYASPAMFAHPGTLDPEPHVDAIYTPEEKSALISKIDEQIASDTSYWGMSKHFAGLKKVLEDPTGASLDVADWAAITTALANSNSLGLPSDDPQWLRLTQDLAKLQKKNTGTYHAEWSSSHMGKQFHYDANERKALSALGLSEDTLGFVTSKDTTPASNGAAAAEIYAVASDPERASIIDKLYGMGTAKNIVDKTRGMSFKPALSGNGSPYATSAPAIPSTPGKGGSVVKLGDTVIATDGQGGRAEIVLPDGRVRVRRADGTAFTRKGTQFSVVAVDPNSTAPATPASSAVFTAKPRPPYATPDWSTTLKGTGSSQTALDRVNLDTRSANAGYSFAADSDQIEDLDVHVSRVLDPNGQEVLELKFKVTPKHGNELFLRNSAAGWETGYMQVQKRIMPQDGSALAQLSTSQFAASSNAHNGRTMRRTFESGAHVQFHQITDLKKVKQHGDGGPYVYHNMMQIRIPAHNATPETIAKAMYDAGIDQPGPANDAALARFGENRLLSIFAKQTNANTETTGTKRASLLAQVKNDWGIGAEDLEVRHGMTGRIEVLVPDSVATKIQQKTGVNYFAHSLKHGTTDFRKMVMGPHGGLMSTSVRWTEGVDVSGQSSPADIVTGGADYVFMSPKSSPVGHGLSFSAKNLFRRTDFYANHQDKFGFRFTSVDILGEIYHGAYETMFKQRVSLDDAMGYITSAQERDQLISEFKAAGITEIGGRTVEQFIVTSSSQFTPPPPVTATVTGVSAP